MRVPSTARIVFACLTWAASLASSSAFADLLQRQPTAEDAELAVSWIAKGITKGGEVLSVPPSPALLALLDSLAQKEKLGASIERKIWVFDPREQIDDTSELPYAAIGYLEGLQQGAGVQCTGVLVGPRVVLTAAHCLYDAEARTWLSDFAFVPGLMDETTIPFGVSRWEKAFIVNGFVENYRDYYASSAAWDIGILILDQPVPSGVGWLPLVELGSMPEEWTLIGYPFDQPTGTMWKERCSPLDSSEPAGRLLAISCSSIFSHPSGGALVDNSAPEARLAGIYVAEGGAEEGQAIILDALTREWLGPLLK